ncbi:MAG: nicotinate-nucleotide adenylyltransferase [Endomicrobiales bacterium]
MAQKKRIGLFGGSFDPVHCGHLLLAEAARKEFALDRVLFIPARIPPHKRDKRLSPAAHRLAMLALALERYPAFGISRFELKRKTTTYTFQTVEHFKRLFPRAEIFFLIGSDSLLELTAWKNAGRLLSLCAFVAARRKGVRVGKDLPFRDRVKLTREVIPPVSSTKIRERVKAGKTLKGLVPPAVERYIARHHLYRSF